MYVLHLVAPAARRRGDLRGGADPQGREIVAHCDLEAERAVEPPLRRARDRGHEPVVHRRGPGARLRVRLLPERPGPRAHQAGAARDDRDARAVPPRRPARRPDPSHELQARLARGHLPRRHEGERRPALAVYKRSYRPYEGPLTPERWRFLVVPRYALQELVESRVLMAFVVLCLFPFLAEAAGIYVANSEAARALLQVSGQPNPMRHGVLRRDAGLAGHARLHPDRLGRSRARLARPRERRASALSVSPVLARRVRARARRWLCWSCSRS